MQKKEVITLLLQIPMVSLIPWQVHLPSVTFRPSLEESAPSQAALNETLSLTISGQNFKEGVRVSLLKSSTEIICTSPVSTESTKIVCNLDLRTINGASAGDWDVTVLNIDGQQTATWNQKFRITRAT